MLKLHTQNSTVRTLGTVAGAVLALVAIMYMFANAVLAVWALWGFDAAGIFAAIFCIVMMVVIIRL